MEKERLNHLHATQLGMCGCGRPEEIKDMIKNILDIQNRLWGSSDDMHKTLFKEREEYLKNLDHNLFLEFVLHTLEKAGFVEHGFSVYSSRLTEKGHEYLSLLKENTDGE